MTRRAFLLAAALLLVLHSVALVLSNHQAAISAVFILACSLSAAAGCYRRSTLTSGPVRRKWDFLASSLCLWSLGELIVALKLLFPPFGHVNVLGPEFYYMVYGIPVLLAISSSNEERDSVLFILIDSFQAVFAVGLVYLEIWLHQRGKAAALGGPNLTYIYGAASWLLAMAAGLRLLARPRGEEKALYRILFVYLFFFAVLASPWRGDCVLNGLPLGPYRELLADITFLIMTAGCLLVRAEPEPDSTPFEMNSFALVLNNGGPILFTLAVLALGALVAHQHVTWGVSAIALSLVIYCFRAALLQSAYMHAQHALTRSQYALREANARLKQLSLHDALTGLPNRRQFDQALDLEWNRAMRNRRLISLLIVDVDCFKALNDRYGHPTGDDSLSRIASALQNSLRRAGEVAARYGGEEFAAILPDIDAAGAAAVAETMREAVLALQILNEGSSVERFVTASIGVATMQPTAEVSTASLIAAADEALYIAKRTGRNRVQLAESVPVGG